MQQGDFSSYYQYPYNSNPNPNPNPNPIPIPSPSPNLNPTPAEFHRPPYASAPPFSSSYTSSDYSVYPSNYPPYSQNVDAVPPAASSYTPPPSATIIPPAITPQSSFNQQPIAPPSVTASPSFPPYDSQVPYQPPTSQPHYYQLYDQHQTSSSYGPAPPNPNPTPNPPYYSNPYGQVGSLASSVPPAYENTFDNPLKFDHGGAGYFDDKFGGGYNLSRSDFGPDLYGKRSDNYSRYDDDGCYGDGVYAYQEGKVEPYGARGSARKSSSWVQFDDYGRSINFPSAKDSSGGSGSSAGKILKAVPKVETQQDEKSGVQKFRVKLLSESGAHGPMDVLCQIGLDGIRMLEPSSSRTLRIYPLENITRCEVMDSSTLAFWSKSSVDIEPRRIRLQSNSYTTNTLLDIVTAATVQIKEMGWKSRPPEPLKTADLSAEKKRGFADWMNIIKPGVEEKDHWVPDEAVSKCTACATDFGAFVRKHHCRNCGDIFCDKCTQGRTTLTADENAQPVRVCDRCMAEVTRRLSNAKEAASKPTGLQSHEDLARKLQEEMGKSRSALSGTKSNGSGRQMKEVACPTCTVHLQVQVPSSGSETVECGVCQHPFLVSAH
ncbi:putative zinc finger protein [Hibiscus syriacus]|uniref:Zinc finger protein n=1 Tax=Hibiscus syriacus TaxID=106335 RepID=A0A6A2XJ60_HIBSY|nr:protein FREE1-like [Hibiscus syriacus]KAE8656457.1 putative zinc finger protein [Hibiscus syriacus]